MIEKQLSLFLVNKPGVLADVCQTLADHQINIRGMSVSDTVDHAVVRLIVDDPTKAIHLLGEHGVLVVETDVLAVEVDDQPGALARLPASSPAPRSISSTPTARQIPVRRASTCACPTRERASRR